LIQRMGVSWDTTAENQDVMLASQVRKVQSKRRIA
jgi:hypothetical protein